MGRVRIRCSVALFSCELCSFSIQSLRQFREIGSCEKLCDTFS